MPPSPRAPAAGPPSWSQLPAEAKAFRLAHLAWGAASLVSLGHIWRCAVTGRRDRPLGASIAFLLVEGAALVAGRGDCPMGPFQRRLGDPVPMFELVLPPRAARAAVPVLAVISVAGIAIVAVRALGRRLSRPQPPARPSASAPARRG